MSNWLLLTTRGDKRRMLVRLDAVQFVREGYGCKASIAFEGDEGFVGVEESFDAVCKTIESLWREGERIIEVAEDGEADESDVPDPDNLDCFYCQYYDVPEGGGKPCNRCKKGIAPRNPAYENAPVLWKAKRNEKQ